MDRSMNTTRLNRRSCLLHGAALATGLVVRWPALAAEDHSAHAQGAAGNGVKRREVTLEPANVNVKREDGRAMNFRRALDDGRPVMLNFIFTSCTAICPVMTQVFREVRERLGPAGEQLLAVSVSIDPEFDTPARLAEYARRFGGGTPSWRFFTATAKEAIAIQQSFDAYQGDKMNHLPLSFVRGPSGSTWTRFDGFASPSMLVQAVRPLLNGAALTKSSAVRAPGA
jgi:protein SCO1/2